MIHYQQGDLPDAATDFSAALRLEPANWQVSTNLGVVYARLGRMDEAAGAFRKALTINPDDANARSNLKKLSEIGR